MSVLRSALGIPQASAAIEEFINEDPTTLLDRSSAINRSGNADSWGAGRQLTWT
jgi:hypothetical protein